MKKPQLTFKQYSLSALVIAGLLLLGVSVFNRIIDPYGIWPAPRVKQLNAAKTRRADAYYLFKARDLTTQRPVTLYMGSSRTAFSMSPDAAIVTQGGHAPAYNGGLLAGNLEITRRYLEHAIFNNPDLKTVVLGVDFFTFNKSLQLPVTFRQERLIRHSIWWRDLLDNHLSLYALADSIKTLADNRQPHPHEPYASNGQLTTWQMQENVRRQGMKQRFQKSLSIYANSSTRFKHFEFDPYHWQQLIEIGKLTAAHNIDLVLFVSPVHLSLFEVFYQRDVWNDYLVWLQQLSDAFEVWDYSLPNHFNGEAMNDNAQYFWDVSHCRAEVGDLMQLDFFGPKDAPKLGFKLSGVNANNYIRELDQKFLLWRSQNAETIKLIKNIVN